MNESKLEKFRFPVYEKKFSKELMHFLGVKSKQEKEFKKKFPETPYFLNDLLEWWTKSYLENKENGKYVMPGLGKITENEKEYIEYSLAEIGSKFRNIYIDFANERNSQSLCWEYSVRLRDIYNHFFEQIGLNQEAFLIYGRFDSATHHWVAINENASEIPNIETLSKNTLYDGTIDQFANVVDFPYRQRISELNFATIEPESDLRSLYKWEEITPVPKKYFQED